MFNNIFVEIMANITRINHLVRLFHSASAVEPVGQ